MFRYISITKFTLRKFNVEVKLLVLMGVFEESNDSKWPAPSFAQTNPKINQVHFPSYLINLNEQLKHKPYPIPKINEMYF